MNISGNGFRFFEPVEGLKFADHQQRGRPVDGRLRPRERVVIDLSQEGGVQGERFGVGAHCGRLFPQRDDVGASASAKVLDQLDMFFECFADQRPHQLPAPSDGECQQGEDHQRQSVAVHKVEASIHWPVLPYRLRLIDRFRFITPGHHVVRSFALISCGEKSWVVRLHVVN